MGSQDVRRALRNLGFSQYEADAYLALLDRGTASAVTVAEASGVPKSRIYDVLRALEDAGYVETYEQDSLQARVPDPDSVVESLTERARAFTETAAEIEARWEEPTLAEHQVTIVRRPETVLEHTREWIRGAGTEVKLCATPDQLAEFEPFLREAHDGGVFVKLAVTVADGEPPDPDRWEGIATVVRYRRLPAPFVALIDHRRTGFALRDDLDGPFGLLADNPTLTYVFHWYFQSSLWDVWEEVYSAYGEGIQREYINIRACVRDLLPVLADGATVEATVVGRDTATGEERTLSGTIADVVYTGQSDDDAPALSELSGRVTVVLETEDGTREVGGWNAVVEDVEMHRLAIDRIVEGD